jgi:hypothetical protein
MKTAKIIENIFLKKVPTTFCTCFSVLLRHKFLGRKRLLVLVPATLVPPPLLLRAVWSDLLAERLLRGQKR